MGRAVTDGAALATACFPYGLGRAAGVGRLPSRARFAILGYLHTVCALRGDKDAGTKTEKKRNTVNPLLVIMLILLVVSGLGLIVFILLHSGKGTGISDMIASSVYSTQTGTSIVEKNLDRITIIFAIVFLVSLIVLMIIYPHGTISAS